MELSDITIDAVKRVMASKGYPLKDGYMNLNPIGIRSNNRLVDNWDDFFVVLYEKDGKTKLFSTSEFTTDPGIYYMQKKIINPRGCGIMAPGNYPGLWTKGIHNSKYEAFIQVGPVTVYRDRNKDNYLDFDPTTLETGFYGANLHHGYNAVRVYNNSAMCQVLRNPTDLTYILSLYNEHKALHGTVVDYTLLEENDFKLS